MYVPWKCVIVRRVCILCAISVMHIQISIDKHTKRVRANFSANHECVSIFLQRWSSNWNLWLCLASNTTSKLCKQRMMRQLGRTTLFVCKGVWDIQGWYSQILFQRYWC